RETLLDDPADEATWSAYSDWLQDRDLPPVGVLLLEQALRAVARYPFRDIPYTAWEAVRKGSVREARAALEAALAVHEPGRALTHDPAKSRIHVEEDLAQLCVHVGHWEWQGDVYQQWIFFDDLWAAAHPDLANSILRYKRCWDMLSPDG